MAKGDCLSDWWVATFSSRGNCQFRQVRTIIQKNNSDHSTGSYTRDCRPENQQMQDEKTAKTRVTFIFEQTGHK